MTKNSRFSSEVRQRLKELVPNTR